MAELMRLSDVSKTYRRRHAAVEVLHDVHFAIAQQETVAITGASGAGKSTLLHVMGTLDAPDRGNVWFMGQSLGRLDANALALFRNQKLGFVFQFHHLLPDFSALENVMMPALIRRDTQSVAQQQAKRALDEVGLSHRMSHRPSELSGGEQQRVALARALVLRPPLLLADEVTGNLDQKTAATIHDLLLQINHEHHIAIVAVTHSPTLAHVMSRRVLLVDKTLRAID